MTKRILGLALATMVGLLVAGCASTNVSGNSDWRHNEFLADKIATEALGEAAISGVGQSSLSKITAEKAARADGRAALAQRISTVVSNKIKEQRSEESQNEGTENYGEDTTLIANAVLSGSAQVDYLYDESDGLTYVLMALPLEGLDKKLKSASMKINNKEVRDFLNAVTEEQLIEMFSEHE